MTRAVQRNFKARRNSNPPRPCLCFRLADCPAGPGSRTESTVTTQPKPQNFALSSATATQPPLPNREPRKRAPLRFEMKHQSRRQKEADKNGLPQISLRCPMAVAGCAYGLHSTTKLAGPEGTNRARHSGSEARCPGGGRRDTRGLEPGQAARFEHRDKRAAAEPAGGDRGASRPSDCGATL